MNMGVLFSFVMGNYTMDISDRLRQMFIVLTRDYKDYKEKNGLYDFMDLPQYLLDKLNDYNLDIDGIDALFVDEFQDVDDVQLKLLERTPTKKKAIYW